MKTASVLSFVGGSISVHVSGYANNGSGELYFRESDVEYSNEDGIDFLTVQVPKSELLEIRDFLNRHLPGATEDDPVNRGCTLPPVGWYCSREPGHEGPCAARQAAALARAKGSSHD